MMVADDQEFQRAVDVAACAFMCCVHRPDTNSMLMFRERMIEALRKRGAIAGHHVEALKLREVLDAVMERSLAIFETELMTATGQWSLELADAIEVELSRMLRRLSSLIGDLTPTAH